MLRVMKSSSKLWQGRLPEVLFPQYLLSKITPSWWLELSKQKKVHHRL